MAIGTQFRLRTLLGLLMVAGLVLGLWSARYQCQNAVVRQLREHGAIISYGDSLLSSLIPAIVTQRLPDDFHRRVIAVSIPQASAFGDSDIEAICRLRHLQCFVAFETTVSHRGFQRIRDCHTGIKIVCDVPLDIVNLVPQRIHALRVGMTWCEIKETLGIADYSTYIVGHGGGEMHGGPRVRTYYPLRLNGYTILFTFDETGDEPSLIDFSLYGDDWRTPSLENGDRTNR